MKWTSPDFLISTPNMLLVKRSLMKPSPRAVSLRQQAYPCSVGSSNALDCPSPPSPFLTCFSFSDQFLIFITAERTVGNSSELQGNIFLDLHLPSLQKMQIELNAI